MTNKDYEKLEAMSVTISDMLYDAKVMYNNNKSLELLDLLLRLELTDITLDSIFYHMKDKEN